MYVKKNMNAKRHIPFLLYLSHTRCYVCDNIGPKVKDYNKPFTPKKCKQKMEEATNKLNNEANANNKRKPTKAWKRKKKEQVMISMT